MQTNIQIIESALLNWVSVLSGKTISSFFQLIDCQFYLSLLSQVQQFKLIQPLQDLQKINYNELNLTQRMNRVKVLGKSIIRFYQTKLLRDVSTMNINYVQLCMGNHSESMKFFSIIIGILATDSNCKIYQKLLSSLEDLNQNQKCIIMALLQNSKYIGESINSKVNQSPLQRKKIISKLQKYQERIQELEQINQLIKVQCQQEKSRYNLEVNRVKCLQEEKKNLIQKIQTLEINNQKLQNQSSMHILKAQTLQRKIQIQKRHYEEMLSINNTKNSQLEHQILKLAKYRKEYQQLKNINKELKMQLSQTKKQMKSQQHIHNLIKISNENVTKKYEDLMSQFQNLELKHHKLILDLEYYTTQKKNKQSAYSDCYDSNQGSSNKYRIKDNLSLIRQNLSEISISSLINSNPNQKEKVQNSDKQRELYSNPIDLFNHSRQMEGFSCKKVKNICNVSQFNEQSKQKKPPMSNQKFSQQKQFFINQNQIMKTNCEQQIEVLVMVNQQLFKQNQQKQNIIKQHFLQKQSEIKNRQLFKQKLKQIDVFQRQRAQNYQIKKSTKENIDPNLKSQQNSQKLKKQETFLKSEQQFSSIKSVSNNSQAYYQMVFN